MPAKLVDHSYGKSQVRLTKVTRQADRHDLKELTVNIQLEGDFDASYFTGDNRQVVATDSMKNTVYVLAKNHPLETVESFALDLAKHFVERYEQVESAAVSIEQSQWKRIMVGGREHAHAFTAGSSETRGCAAVVRANEVVLTGDLNDLVVLKTTDSAFRDFVRDEFTTLPDTDDRIFATSVSAHWTYLRTDIHFDDCFARFRRALLETFAGHKSLAVQQTLYAMGEAALAACPEIDHLALTMPNQHRIPVNLAPFGLENRNEIFVPTDEPYGLITALMERD